jgi:hypothetical protein
MDFPVDCKVSIGDRKTVRITSQDKVILFVEEKDGNPQPLKTVENVAEESILLAHYTEPVEVLFCWDGDCDIAKPNEIESYIRDFVKESPVEALEEAEVIFLYPLFHTYDGAKYLLGVIGTVEVYEEE